MGEPAQDGTPPVPRPLLVKFAIRRSENRVILKCKNLQKPRAHDSVGRMEGSERELTLATPDIDDAVDGDETVSTEDGENIYMSDDLTKRWATLAYRARMARRNKEIQETWVIDWKIMIKNNYGRISQISSEADLQGKNSTIVSYDYQTSILSSVVSRYGVNLPHYFILFPIRECS